MNLDQYQRLKAKVEAARKRADKAAGALDQLKKQLKDEFGCTDLKAAKALLKKLESSEAEAERAADAAMEAFDEKWGELLGGGE